mmetsp:Transcript_99530/g.171323  ORF Transcript_99530/g.171323 Transcript_99530/m.171323 type:complete len:254 (+) Transcript_99530:1294-2055(+)
MRIAGKDQIRDTAHAQHARQQPMHLQRLCRSDDVSHAQRKLYVEQGVGREQGLHSIFRWTAQQQLVVCQHPPLRERQRVLWKEGCKVHPLLVSEGGQVILHAIVGVVKENLRARWVQLRLHIARNPLKSTCSNHRRWGHLGALGTIPTVWVGALSCPLCQLFPVLSKTPVGSSLREHSTGAVARCLTATLCRHLRSQDLVLFRRWWRALCHRRSYLCCPQHSDFFGIILPLQFLTRLEQEAAPKPKQVHEWEH